MSAAYYNEIDPFAAQWLRELIAAGHIAPGDVDTRSIVDVRPDDLRGYTQCHFFAGIGVWSYSLRLAGWTDTRPIWTGSCPCQPFSGAGKGGGFADERHLWPFWLHLIVERSPDLVLGEQVASKDGLQWLDLVQADLEGAGFAIGAADTCSAGYGAPHIRQRIRFAAERVAHPDGSIAKFLAGSWDGAGQADCARPHRQPDGRGVAGGLAELFGERHAHGSDCDPHTEEERLHSEPGNGRNPGLRDRATGRVANSFGHRWGECGDRHHCRDVGPQLDPDGGNGRLADNDRLGCRAEAGRSVHDAKHHAESRGGMGEGQPGPTNGFWRDADWLFCRDGRWRPVESGTFPLAHGATARVGRLRGYGNAVDAQATAGFIEAYLDTRTIGAEGCDDAA